MYKIPRMKYNDRGSLALFGAKVSMVVLSIFYISWTVRRELESITLLKNDTEQVERIARNILELNYIIIGLLALNLIIECFFMRGIKKNS